MKKLIENNIDVIMVIILMILFAILFFGCNSSKDINHQELSSEPIGRLFYITDTNKVIKLKPYTIKIDTLYIFKDNQIIDTLITIKKLWLK